MSPVFLFSRPTWDRGGAQLGAHRGGLRGATRLHRSRGTSPRGEYITRIERKLKFEVAVEFSLCYSMIFWIRNLSMIYHVIISGRFGRGGDYLTGSLSRPHSLQTFIIERFSWDRIWISHRTSMKVSVIQIIPAWIWMLDLLCVWNWVYSASWVELRSYLKGKVAAPV
jgi:hypothetical protein